MPRRPEEERLLEKALVLAERAIFWRAPADDRAARILDVRERIAGVGSDELLARARDLDALGEADPTSELALQYRDRHGAAGVRRFDPSSGDRIYQISAETFPGHVNHVYFIAGEESGVLWDVGSGVESARQEILDGLETARTVWGESRAAVDRLTDVVVSHAHVDHFGDAAFFKTNATAATFAVHELDARVLENFEERMTVASKDIGVYLMRAGVPQDRRDEMETMYRLSKSLFRSIEIDRRLKSGDLVAGKYEVLHTAGHCPGHLCMHVGDHLLVADQVLSPITPHISPQSITPFTGLENYVRALLRMRLLEGVAVALPAHCDVMYALGPRIDEILAHHRERLEVVLEACRTPKTIRDVAAVLFGTRSGYDELLAILEAGAHMEYLNELAHLRIANLEQLQSVRDPVIEFVTR